jgi:hypothetical protein
MSGNLMRSPRMNLTSDLSAAIAARPARRLAKSRTTTPGAHSPNFNPRGERHKGQPPATSAPDYLCGPVVVLFGDEEWMAEL